MHPVLFDLGPIQIRTYGVLLSFAFLFGLWLAVKRGRDRGIDTPLIYDLAIVIILSAIAGSRAYYVFVNREYYEGNLLSALKVWEGGLSMYGGVILAIAASFVFSRQKKVRFNKIADVIAPSLAIGLMVTRVGCFFNGCCFGKTTSIFTGMVFPSNSEAGRILFGETIHPTQLYASLYGLIIFLILIVVDRKSHRDGFLFALFLIFYSVSRFVIDFFRYYDDSSIFTLLGIDLGYNQVISVILFIYGMVFVFRSRGSSVDKIAGQKSE
jgi:phosphatidylglycerol:prolipoprotein diacylglycerol transferase